MSVPVTILPRILAIFLLVAASAPTAAANEDPPSCPDDARWGLVIDAGSSGSRLRIYCWRPGVDGALPQIEDAGTRKQQPGIADAGCSRTPTEAVAALSSLVDGALELVGRERSAETPLWLMATGGLRQCPQDYRDAMLAGIRDYLASTPFADSQAVQISGAEEGRYGWTGVNYLLGRLETGAPRATTGALDLGGASTQITFMPPTCAGGSEACGELEVGDRSFPLYTHSYLGWGQDQAMLRVASDACYLRGYRSPDGSIDGRGKNGACRRAIRKAMARARRSDPPGPSCARSCNRLGVYQPPVAGDFVAFSAFAYTTAFLGLGPELTLAQLRAAGKHYCRTPWREAIAGCRSNPRAGCRKEWLNRYCFSSAYIVTLLHGVYGLPMNQRIISSNELAGADIDWTLGVMVRMASEHSASEQHR